MTDPDAHSRAEALYTEGARLLDAAWDDGAGMLPYETGSGTLHDGRGTLAYADVLLRRGDASSVARAERAIANCLAMQERREQDAHHGNFRWFREDACVTDLNAVEFALDHLNALVREHATALAAATLDAIRSAIALGLQEIDRLDVHPSYTNIALSDICNSVLGGELLGDEAFVERGRRRLDEWLEFTNRSGAPHEFNSPTYCAVDIARLAFLAEHTRDATTALKARIAEERLWLHVASHYHPQLAQLAGPHSRSYRDGWTGAGGYLKLILWRLLGDDNLRRPTPFFPEGREEGHTGVARATFHCPDYVVEWLRDKRYPLETIETADAASGSDIATYMTAGYCLGTASRAYAVGDPPEPWPMFNSTLIYFRRDAAPGYGVLYARYIIDDKRVGEVRHESMRNVEDLWDEGVFLGAQHRGRAIIAYGLRPRARPSHSCKLSIRVLGIDAQSEVWAGGRRLTDVPARVDPGEPVVIAEGDAYIAIIPLEPSNMGAAAPIELTLDGDQLALDICNYRGPPKTFWEHRSQSGPFYKGNLRNAFIIEVAGREEYADVASFRRHVGEALVADSVDEDYTREIAYASGDATIALRYSLWDMELIERRFSGAPYVPPMARSGALDGSGLQWLQSRDTLIELGRAKLLAGRTPKWLVADTERSRYVYVNPSDEEAPLWLETPGTVVECDAFAFGRVDVNDAAGTVNIEAAGEIGELRIRAGEALRLSINGRDATPLLSPPDADGVRELMA